MEGTGQPRRCSASAGIAMAAALVAAALGITLLLQNFISTAGYIFFYVAVLASAWYGEYIAGWTAVVLSGLTVAYFFTPPIHSLAIHRDSLPLFVEFAASAAIVGWFSSWRRMAESELKDARDHLQSRVEERTAELRRSNEQLITEMAERKRAEDAYYEARAELTRAHRVSALGALAASISHEVNQPLAAVVTNADACSIWLSGDPPNLDEARIAAECIAREGTRASDVVRRIRALFTKGAPEQSSIAMNDLIRETAALLDAEISRHHVSLELDLASGLGSISGDRIQLQQVLMNLAINAIEAMSAVNRPRRLQIRSEMRGEEVLVLVSDSGIGIAPQDQRRMFDAFFTTKPQGMGMGLSISQSVIEAHGGRLSIMPNPDCGVTLQFALRAV